MRALGKAACVWQPMQPFVAKRSAPRSAVRAEAGSRVVLLEVAVLLVVAEFGPPPVVKLAAASSTANVPQAASSAIDLSI
jgi:hypothetical protein